jgi:hypothetical protein
MYPHLIKTSHNEIKMAELKLKVARWFLLPPDSGSWHHNRITFSSIAAIALLFAKYQPQLASHNYSRTMVIYNQLSSYYLKLLL